LLIKQNDIKPFTTTIKNDNHLKFSSIDDEEKECTFQPKLNSNFQFYHAENNLNMLDRFKIWHEQKQEKLASEREREKDKDIEECTFKPDIVKKLFLFFYTSQNQPEESYRLRHEQL
jgi:hypothetical protein